MQQRPVPRPRTQLVCPVKREDDELVKCNPTPQPPPKSPESGLGRSAPPPLPPKKMIVKKRPRGSQAASAREEMVKAVDEQSSKSDCKAQPPLPPVKLPIKKLDNDYENLDASSLLDYYKEVIPWDTLAKDLKDRGATEEQTIMVKAKQLYEAIQVYIQKMSECCGTLKQHIYELRCIADNLDKVSKGTKIAGITGGATTVAGGVAAAAGVILSPFTLGASLALTAVGVGVAAAGGVTGASAAIANKVNVTQDKKKINKTLQDYGHLSKEIQECLKFINEGMEQLQQHGVSVLNKTKMDSERVTKVVQLAAKGGASAMALEANSKASGLIQGFALGMDFFFVQGKDGEKVKKGLESKFAKKIRKLAEDLDDGWDELLKIKDLFSEHCSGA